MNWYDELVVMCGQALIFYVVYKAILFFFKARSFAQDVHETNEGIRVYLESIMHSVKSEKHGDMIYFFDQDDDTFIAQGRNDAELAEAMRARWGNHVFILGDTTNGHYVMAGPEFEMVKVTDPDQVGKILADKVLSK